MDKCEDEHPWFCEECEEWYGCSDIHVHPITDVKLRTDGEWPQ